MRLEDAFSLISAGVNAGGTQKWADLGCGSGTFTKALAHSLGEASHIYAVDKQPQYFASTRFFGTAEIEFLLADFDKSDLPFTGLDGILMANSLHYVRDKKSLINKLRKRFAGANRFLIVEYDIRRVSTWVPYPLDFQQLNQLFEELGYPFVSKISQRPSAFGVGNLYAALITS